jgi:hypothetical protein
LDAQEEGSGEWVQGTGHSKAEETADGHSWDSNLPTDLPNNLYGNGIGRNDVVVVQFYIHF